MGKRDRLAKFLFQTHFLDVLAGWSQHLLILNYHRIKNDCNSFRTAFDDGVFGPSVSEFDRQMAWLSRHARVLSEHDLIEGLAKQVAPKGPAVLVTFDDGYADNFHLAFPVLKRYSIPAIFFLCPHLLNTRSVGWWDLVAYLVKQTRKELLCFRTRTYDLSDPRSVIRSLQRELKTLPYDQLSSYLEELSGSCEVPPPPLELQDRELMTWEQASTVMEANIAIGSHTHTHRVLSTLPAEVQAQELERSKTELETRLGNRIHSLAYPVGGSDHFSEMTADLAQRIGYQLAFSYRGGANRWPDVNRFDIRRTTPPACIERFAGAVRLPRWFAL